MPINPPCNAETHLSSVRLTEHINQVMVLNSQLPSMLAKLQHKKRPKQTHLPRRQRLIVINPRIIRQIKYQLPSHEPPPPIVSPSLQTPINRLSHVCVRPNLEHQLLARTVAECHVHDLLAAVEEVEVVGDQDGLADELVGFELGGEELDELGALAVGEGGLDDREGVGG